jgi:hypothetical protein
MQLDKKTITTTAVTTERTMPVLSDTTMMTGPTSDRTDGLQLSLVQFIHGD